MLQPGGQFSIPATLVQENVIRTTAELLEEGFSVTSENVSHLVDQDDSLLPISMDV
jgi:hypothetical protein